MTTESLAMPLKTGADGVVRIAGTRVTLDTVVLAFDEGASAEEIAQQYPSLSLPNVYAVLAYYLAHHDEVEAYLRDRGEQAALVRQQNQQRFDPTNVRARLLARR